ncbi:hypothetical protein CPT_Moonbeam140 [Bacillus phage Moonbeam]|uniref:Uncharacterized protein n=1 Tax=Bacillus phage Moonbeam TaxID=1540091 RepID=A0A0A0RV74_9CAUD|nr:hypothetical protein CPT_Moonbeam140 [Bacillus phage Moonbeam]AIW03538.1 hypothetical protein CPT_Moonbeam140 [Bacillus phage Moonbeam]
MADKIKLDGGKYEIITDLANGVFEARRHGQPWRDLVGDKLILALISRLKDAEDLLKATLEDYEGEQYWAIERYLEENE